MTTAPDISRYDASLPAPTRAIASLLHAELNRALPGATSKVWHGSPVWFDGLNPLAGYSAQKSAVQLLFWNGQALGEPALAPIGKYRAAEARFTRVEDVDVRALRRWLEKARTMVFDGVSYFAKLREAAKRRAQAGKSGALAKAPSRRTTKARSAGQPKKRRTSASRRRAAR